MEPLSVAEVGEFDVEPPAFTEAAAYVTEGGVLAVTVTVRLAVAVPELPSVTVRTTVLAPRTAVQFAATFAVMVPAVLVMPVTVIPAGTVTDWRYLEKLARLDFAAQSASPGSPSPVHRALSEILKTCKKDLAPSVFLLDSRAGLHDLG